ncbi:hypothetical protein IL54_0298 [Sphingobium sp. ba1]|nr:hypothetical protein IL54_0298 [Sphingobium sp. ba1]
MKSGQLKIETWTEISKYDVEME